MLLDAIAGVSCLQSSWFSNLLLHQQRRSHIITCQPLALQKLVTCPDAVSVQPQDAVVVDFVGSHAPERQESDNDASRPVFQIAQDWLIVIGEKDVVPALELAVRFLNEGETAVVWSQSKFAYGVSQRTHGTYTLPAHSNVQYRVTVRSILPSDDPTFALKVAAAKKEIGNDAFQHEWDATLQAKAKALNLYKRGADYLQHLVGNPDGDVALLAQARSIYLDCLNNVVAVQLRAADYHAAKEAAIKVLSVDPHNTKALLRAAKAALWDPASSYEEVQAALEAAAVHATSDLDRKDLHTLQQEFRRQKQVYQQRNKAIMANISKAMTKESPRTKEGGESSSSKDAGVVENDVVPREDTSAKPPKETPGMPTTQDSSEVAATPPAFEWRKLLFSLFSQLAMAAIAYAFTMWVKPQWAIGDGLLANNRSPDTHGEF